MTDTNIYGFSRFSLHHNTSSVDEQGRKITTSWHRGYGHENKDGKIRYFITPSNFENFVETDEKNYKQTQEQICSYLNQKSQEQVTDTQPQEQITDAQPQEQVTNTQPQEQIRSLRQRLHFPRLHSNPLSSLIFDQDFFGIEPSDLERELKELLAENAKLRRELRTRN